MNKIKNDYVYIIFYYHIDNEMFDLNYFRTINAVKKNADQMNDYSKLKNVLHSREDYVNLYHDLMTKYKLNLETYTIMRTYEMLCDAYFKDYVESVCLKKLNYIQKVSLTHNTHTENKMSGF